MKPFLPTSPRRLFTLCALALASAVAQAGNPDVEQYIAVKGQHFLQPGEGTPVPATNGPHRFIANVVGSGPTTILGASVRKPNNTSVTLTHEEGDNEFYFEPVFATKAALDAAYPAGNYAFTIRTANQATQFVTLNLAADAYPPAAPHVANWVELQSAETNGTTVQWDAWPDAPTNSFILFSVEDSQGDEVFSTAGPGDPMALPGSATSAVIPGGLLAVGQTYYVTIVFANPTVLDTASVPGALGIAGYYRQTTAAIVVPTPPPASGRFRFASTTFAGGETEGGGEAIVTILRQGSSGTASVVLSTVAGTASPGQDYGETTQRVTFNDGEESMDVSLSIAYDALLEGNETFRVILSDPSAGAELGFPTNATVTIVDDEIRGRGTLQFSAAAFMAVESAGVATLNVTRTGGATGEVAVVYAAESGSAEVGPDFAPSVGLLVFSNGVASRTISIPLVTDTLDESNETFTVTLFNPIGGAALGAIALTTVTIKDDDTAGTIAFSTRAYGVTENVTNFPVIIRRTGGAASAVTVDLEITGGTATAVDDYDHGGGTLETLTFGAGVTAITNIFAIKEDLLPEGNEDIRLALRNATGGARVAGFTNSVLTIIDDEVTIQFAADNFTNKEPAGTAILYVERTGPVTAPSSVTFATTSNGSSAGAFEDYIPTNITVSFAVNQRRKPVLVRLVNDFLVETNETVSLLLEDPLPAGSALLGPRSQATLHITSEDAGGKIAFAVDSVSVSESRPFVPITVVRTLGLASNVTARLRTAGGSAEDGLDYVGTNITLSFAAREVRKVINIAILPDALDERPVQMFEVTLDNATGGAEIGPKSSQGVLILDEDNGGVISFSRAEFIVTENQTNALITITRTGGAAGNVMVQFATTNGTASPTDYQDVSETVLFAAGETTKTVLVPINYVDVEPEGATPETVLLSLRDYTGGSRPGLSNAVLKIVDDESSVAFNAATASGTEGGTVTLTVTRAGALTTAVSVDFMTMGGSATEGADYTATNGTLNFAANQASKTIAVRLLADPNTETNETFTVELKNPQGGVLLGSLSNVVVTISDRPDPAAIPAAGLPFFKANITGVQGNSLSKSIDIKTNSPNVILTTYDQSLGWLGINGNNNRYTPGSESIRTVNNWMQFANIHASGPGVIDISFAAGNGAAIWTFSDTTVFYDQTPPRPPIVHETRAYGTGIQGSSGTITIDVLDTVNRIVTGRFDFIAVDDTDDNKFVRITGSFRSHNTVVSGAP